MTKRHQILKTKNIIYIKFVLHKQKQRPHNYLLVKDLTSNITQ